ncbi:hypothetical protein C3731_20625 [Brucella oryzae]|uniref:Uncharacterized protein n=1 Tax=Brucella oryzae TaxID=335286 RepID=A0A2S7IUL0_9HYPH|nr:hypothetical protein C3731_20625 [Brucella oryzae]
MLYGDGKRDDAPALNALFAGKPIIADSKVIVRKENEPASLRNGKFLVASTVYINKRTVEIEDCYFVHSGTFEGPALYLSHDDPHGFMRRIRFQRPSV